MNTGVYKSIQFEGAGGMGGTNPIGQYAQMGAGVTGSLIGAYQFVKSERDRKKYEGMAVPQAAEDKDVRVARLRAQDKLGYGFDARQRASYMQSLMRANNTAYNRFTTFGGANNSQAASSALASGNFNALNQFAGQDANVALSKEDAFNRNFLNNLQMIKNMNTTREYGRYVDIGKNISQERDAGLQNIVGGQMTFGGAGQPLSGGGGGYENPYAQRPVDYNINQSGAPNDNPYGYDIPHTT